MKELQFSELLASVKEMGSIKEGRIPASRTYKYEDHEIREIRDRYGLTQDQFAEMIGISIGTLRNWEQGRRKPEGPAKILLRIIDKYPRAISQLAKAV
jgi:putative transcriptional regulator